MKDDAGLEIYPDEVFDWEAPDIDPDSREIIIALQPLLRRHATALGNFRTCPLPKCRRSKACTGRHPIERRALPFDHWSNFPPCVDTNEKQSALLAEGRRFEAALHASLRAQGIDPDTLMERR